MTYRANLAAAHLKAEFLNGTLPELQEEFEDALSRGEILELGQMKAWSGDVKELLGAAAA